jgi:hypothetical protein
MEAALCPLMSLYFWHLRLLHPFLCFSLLDS